MKNLMISMLLLSIVACNPKTIHIGVQMTSEEKVISIVEGNWLTDCVGFLGAGNYGRVYGEVNFPNEYLAYLNYGADSTCSGAYSLVDVAGNPISSPYLVGTFEVLHLANIPNGYLAAKLHDGSAGLVYGLLYAVSKDKMYLSPLIGNNPGSTWAEWLADPSLSSFATDFTSGAVYNRVSGLP